jgi:hypothetical protein
MDPEGSRPEESAPRKVLLPVLGLLGGLLVGGVRAWLWSGDPIRTAGLVIAGGLVGSTLGMAAVLATAYPLRRWNLSSLRGLLILGLIAAVVTWFVLVMLRVPLGREIP